MAITIKRAKNERGIELQELKCGDTFLYDNRIGVIATRNGHLFPMDLATCSEFRKNGAVLNTLKQKVIVLPIDIELNYKVVG